MSSRTLGWALAAACVAALPASADDLTGARQLLCWSSEVTACTPGMECESGLPADWHIPQALRVDLETRKLSTTPASGEERSTTAGAVDRRDGLILLQGMENGRAFSILIGEKTGSLSATVARDGLTLSIFGGCTPLPR